MLFTPFIFRLVYACGCFARWSYRGAIYNKVEDFAMEFYSDGIGGVTFEGYSLFHTGKSGMYEGNCLLSNEAIRKQLSQYVPLETLTDLVEPFEMQTFYADRNCL